MENKTNQDSQSTNSNNSWQQELRQQAQERGTEIQERGPGESNQQQQNQQEQNQSMSIF